MTSGPPTDETGGNVAVGVDQNRGRCAGGAERFAGAEPLVEQNRRLEAMLAVRLRIAGRDEDELRRALGPVFLPALDVVDEPLAETAARIPEQERGPAIANLVKVDLLAFEIRKLHLRRFAADGNSARRRRLRPAPRRPPRHPAGSAPRS